MLGWIQGKVVNLITGNILTNRYKMYCVYYNWEVFDWLDDHEPGQETMLIFKWERYWHNNNKQSMIFAAVICPVFGTFTPRFVGWLKWLSSSRVAIYLPVWKV